MEELDFQPTNFAVAPGDSHYCELKCSLSTPGEFDSELKFYSDAPFDSWYVVDVHGVISQGKALDADAIPAVFTASPNPFNPCTVFTFGLPRSGRASVGIYDIRGRQVRSLETQLEAGRHEAVWDGTGTAGNRVASGVYLCYLTLDGVRLYAPLRVTMLK